MKINSKDPGNSSVDYRIASFGLGTAGCRILSQLERNGVKLGKHHYASCTQSDFDLVSGKNRITIKLPVGGKISQRFVRGAAHAHRDQIDRALEGVDTLFLIAGLGGKVGSALAPMIAEMARERNIRCFSVVVMPFKFEKNKHFTAGVALKWIRSLSDGIIIVDNDEILERFPQAPLQESFELIDKSLALAVSRLFGLADNAQGASLDMDKLLQVVATDGYSVLGTSGPRSDTPLSAVKSAVKSISKTADPREVRKAIIFMAGNAKLSASDLTSAIGTVESFIGPRLSSVDLGYSTGGMVSSALILGSGFPVTKFDKYDPLDSILAGREIDFYPESSIEIDLGRLENIE